MGSGEIAAALEESAQFLKPLIDGLFEEGSY